MYESLTSFIPKLQNDSYGKWFVDNENDGSTEQPSHMPFVGYSQTAHEFIDAVYDFVDSHERMELGRYGDILNKAGIEWGADSMENANVEVLDGTTVMALIIGILRADRFCEGALLGFLKNGCIVKWLRRLQEIDESC